MELDVIVESMREDIIKETCKIIKIRSVKSAAEEGMPFGYEINNCLFTILDLCNSMGFETKCFDGYAAHADLSFCKDNEKVLAILVHLDVVPEGDNWTYSPFGGEIHNRKIYGRGSVDDKGPAIAVIYALKAIKELGLKLNKKIRIIFGTDEESGSECMKYYLKHEKEPNMAFVPDAGFPLIYGEKGIINFIFRKEIKKNEGTHGIKILNIKGGNRINMVPDYCEAHLYVAPDYHSRYINFLESCEMEGIKFIEDGTDFIIKSYGVSMHASAPGRGENAISKLMSVIGQLEITLNLDFDFAKFYNQKIGAEFNGHSLGCDFRDKIWGDLSLNVGMIDVNENSASISVDIRYPGSVNFDCIYKNIINEIDGCDISIETIEHSKPLYVSKESVLVKKLMSVYRDYTGDNSEPFIIGGGTYARTLSNAVAFGPVFLGKSSGAHQKDEFIEIEDLINITKIYAKAMLELAGYDSLQK